MYFSWSTKHPLHVSAAPPSSAGQPSPPSLPPPKGSRPAAQQRSVSSPVPSLREKSIQQVVSLDDSQVDESNAGSTSASGSSFTTALAMLLYNVCYLAHTQNVEVPLAQAGEVLSNLWAVCCSPELGKYVLHYFSVLPAEFDVLLIQQAVSSDGSPSPGSHSAKFPTRLCAITASHCCESVSCSCSCYGR